MRLGDITIHIPDQRGSFQREFDFTQTKGFILRVTAGIDLPTRTATWRFQAIDPATGEVIQDPTKGLLPPNTNGSGVGFVSWTVEAKSGAATGSTLEASARAVFNNTSPQATNTVSYTIDSVAPTTTLTATPLDIGSSNYSVQWQSTDTEANGAAGSG